MTDSDVLWYWGIFIGLSLLFIYVSRKSLREPRSHGFYRFFVFEGVTGMIILNVHAWFLDPLTWNQIISWGLLAVCILYLIEGVRLLRQFGHESVNAELTQKQPERTEIEKAQFQFEKTTNLVQEGLYKYVRHPMYASLLFLGWGAFMKEITWFSGALIAIITIFTFLTAIIDERECVVKFGDEYQIYMHKTKRFIPFII